MRLRHPSIGTAPRFISKGSGVLSAFLPIARLIIKLIIVLLIIALLLFIAAETYDILKASLHNSRERNFLHDVAFILVFIKALNILTSYLETNRIGIRYLIEISIIMPAIEIVFAFDKHPISLLVLFCAFSAINLTLYALLYDRISRLDQATAHRPRS